METSILDYEQELQWGWWLYRIAQGFRKLKEKSAVDQESSKFGAFS